MYKNSYNFCGNGALGLKISQKFLQQNYNVVSIDKNIKNFKKINNDFYIAKADVTKKKNLENLSKKLKKIFKKIDVVIFAPTYKSKDFYFPFYKLSLSSWKKIIEVEINWGFLVSQLFGKIFEDQKKEI